MRLTLRRFSTSYQVTINGEICAEPIFYASTIVRKSPFSASYHNRYMMWEKLMSTAGAEVSNWPHSEIVLATVPGNRAAVRVWKRTGWCSPGCYPENRGTHRVRARVWTGLRFHFTVPTTSALIKYLSSDHIMTWSVRKLCSISRSFTSRF